MRLFAVAVIVLAGALAGAAVQAQTRADMSGVCGQEGNRLGLKGQALADFLTKCWSEGPGAQTRKQCEAEARKQGLSGEGLSAYMNKCTSGQVTMK